MNHADEALSRYLPFYRQRRYKCIVRRRLGLLPSSREVVREAQRFLKEAMRRASG